VTALYTAVPPFPARRRPAPSPTLPTCANARPADAPFEPFTRVDTAADPAGLALPRPRGSMGPDRPVLRV